MVEEDEEVRVEQNTRIKKKSCQLVVEMIFLELFWKMKRCSGWMGLSSK
jgi:hypothetical protein